LPRTIQIFFDGFLLKTPQPGRPSDIWRKTKSYIQDLTSVKYSSDGTPEGLIWMTPNMRENLLRYGDILCLDMQARQYNSPGFPYCSPIGVSSEKQNAQTSKALVVEESTETYFWILQSQHKMESRWSPSRLRIVFGDHKVSPSLMTRLGIQET
jgi:hypothetical protein